MECICCIHGWQLVSKVKMSTIDRFLPLCKYATPPLRGGICSSSSLNLGGHAVALSLESGRWQLRSFLGSGFKIGSFYFLSLGVLSHQVRNPGWSTGDRCHGEKHWDIRYINEKVVLGTQPGQAFQWLSTVIAWKQASSTESTHRTTRSVRHCCLKHYILGVV